MTAPRKKSARKRTLTSAQSDTPSLLVIETEQLGSTPKQPAAAFSASEEIENGCRVAISALASSAAGSSLSCKESRRPTPGGVHDLVQDVVSDLDSLLSFIINLRFGLDGSEPCSHEEIALHLNANLKPCLKEKIRDLLGAPCSSQISAEQVKTLEAKAERALCRRRVAQ